MSDKSDQCGCQRDEQVGGVGNPENWLIEHDVAQCAAADSRHQSQYNEPKKVHFLYDCTTKTAAVFCRDDFEHVNMGIIFEVFTP